MVTTTITVNYWWYLLNSNNQVYFIMYDILIKLYYKYEVKPHTSSKKYVYKESKVIEKLLPKYGWV